MDVGTWAKILLFVAIFIGVLPAVREQWRRDRPGFIRTLKLFAIFIGYCLVGAGLLFALAPAEPNPDKSSIGPTLALLGFILGWIFLGGLWLARLVPRYRDVPRWIDHRYGPVELTLMSVIGLSLFMLLVS